MASELLYFNGINGGNGEYLMPPVSPRFLSTIARGETIPPELLQEFKTRRFQKLNQTFAPTEGVDPKLLNKTGWGVIFRADADPQIREALKQLLDLRKKQATETGDSDESEEQRIKYYKEFTGAGGYQPGESKIDFLQRHGTGPGRVDPRKMPYYLMIVGSPEEIPYTFQYHLDVQFAVGRIYFQTLREYAQYASSVVEAETRPVKFSRTASFFGVQNNDDPATKLSATELVGPLAQSVVKDKPNWKVDTYIQAKATREQLGRLIGGTETPALLFSASHGLGFDKGHKRQLRHQGALLCQDWPGPEAWRRSIPQKFYFSADDVSDSAQLLGMMLFNFACYSAGTPRFDDFFHQNFNNYRQEIATRAFVAQLPQRLLGHPAGGALAVIGHIDRAWGYSFMWEDAGAQLQDFESVMKRLMEGHPIGSALEPFNERYAEVATSLNSELENLKTNKKVDDLMLAKLWTVNNDARDYTIVGDPAVRLAISDDNTNANRDAIASITIWPVDEEPIRSEGDSEPAETSADEQTTATAEFKASVKVTGDPLAFGVSETFADVRQRLVSTLQQFGENLGRIVSQTADNASSLEVTTYVSEDMDGVTYEHGRFKGSAKLCAVTRINIDGDTLVCVPTDDQSINQELWKIHAETVHSAQLHRAEMLKTVISAATGLLNLFKP